MSDAERVVRERYPPAALRVLVVDDHGRKARALASLVRLEGHEALVATGGTEALALVRSHAPEVVLVDLMMPRLDVLELARVLRADPPASGVRLIALAAWPGAGREREWFDGWLVKPVSRKDIREALIGRGGDLPTEALR